MKVGRTLGVIAALLAISALASACGSLHLARQSTEELRAEFLERTPLGSSLEAVWADVDAEVGERCGSSPRRGQLSPERPDGPDDYDYPEIQHVYSACLGWYAFPIPIRTYVFAWWVFGEDGALRDVLVHKEADVL
jgi:hypothetical protein